jgi:hypothetical protein
MGRKGEKLIHGTSTLAGRAACPLRSVAISAMVIRERQKATFPACKGGGFVGELKRSSPVDIRFWDIGHCDKSISKLPKNIISTVRMGSARFNKQTDSSLRAK